MKAVARTAGYLLLIAVAIYATWYRFSNPTLTETQLFLALWPTVIPGLLGAFMAVAFSND